jgi:hypothetical protein
MLRIAILSNGQSELTFSSFERDGLPKPPNGIDAEINGDVILLFDDEAQAVNYVYRLEDISSSINDNTSHQKLAINDIIAAVKADEFVQGYLE